MAAGWQPMHDTRGGLTAMVETLQHDPESVPSDFHPMGRSRLSEKHALGRHPRDHAPPKI